MGFVANKTVEVYPGEWRKSYDARKEWPTDTEASRGDRQNSLPAQYEKKEQNDS